MTTTERSLQAGEILQAVAQQKDKERAKWMKSAGLVEIKRVNITNNKVSCLLSVMTPIVCSLNAGADPSSIDTHLEDVNSIIDDMKKQINESNNEEVAPENSFTDPIDTSSGESTKKKENKKRKKELLKSSSEGEERFSEGELVIGIVDYPSPGSSGRAEEFKQLLQTMSEKVEYLCLNSVGLVKEEITVQPTLLGMAVESLREIEAYILPLLPPTNLEVVENENENKNKNENKNENENENEIVTKLLNSHNDISSSILHDNLNIIDDQDLSMIESLSQTKLAPKLNTFGEPVPKKITILGMFSIQKYV